MAAPRTTWLPVTPWGGGDVPPRRCPQDGQPSRNTAPYRNWAWLCDPGLGRLDPIWESWITDSLAYPLWDYSACKSPVYLLREGQIHNPPVDTWMAQERELHLFARPAPRGGPPCQAAVVAGKNTWWGSDGRASHWQLPPLPRAMIVEGPGRKPENTSRHVSLRALPRSAPDHIGENRFTSSQKLAVQEPL